MLTFSVTHVGRVNFFNCKNCSFTTKDLQDAQIHYYSNHQDTTITVDILRTTKRFLDQVEQKRSSDNKSQVMEEARIFKEKLEKFTAKQLNPNLSFKQQEYIERLNKLI